VAVASAGPYASLLLTPAFHHSEWRREVNFVRKELVITGSAVQIVWKGP